MAAKAGQLLSDIGAVGEQDEFLGKNFGIGGDAARKLLQTFRELVAVFERRQLCAFHKLGA